MIAEASEAVLFRKIQADCPTLLLDEIDAVFQKNTPREEGLRAIFNAGFRKGASAPRCAAVGKDFRVVDYSVF